MEGKTLEQYDRSVLTCDEKYIVILELLITIQYLHSKGYIYMDLNLKNIIINQKKDSILIDFDRLTKTSEACEDQTQDFDCLSVAQEIYKTCKSVKYSLGYVIKYILNENDPVNKNHIFD